MAVCPSPVRRRRQFEWAAMTTLRRQGVLLDMRPDWWRLIRVDVIPAVTLESGDLLCR